MANTSALSTPRNKEVAHAGQRPVKGNLVEQPFDSKGKLVQEDEVWKVLQDWLQTEHIEVLKIHIHLHTS